MLNFSRFYDTARVGDMGRGGGSVQSITLKIHLSKKKKISSAIEKLQECFPELEKAREGELIKQLND